MDSGTAYIQKSKNCWLAYRNPVDLISVHNHSEVLKALSLVEEKVASGLFAAGFLSYEAAPAFDAALSVHECSSLPLLWFAIYDSVDECNELPEPDSDYSLSEWKPSISEDEYLDSIEKIKAYIEAGDTYQVNYTTRLTSEFQGNPYSFFFNLQRAQGGRNCAFINADEFAVCSASPELFIALNGRFLKSCPMKGTAKRGLTSSEDEKAAESLKASLKDRAENIMIVDMIRNDMGRIAESGSVHLDSAFDVERYPTVLQMTSTVRSKTSCGITDILKAMFPCASVTGAPKVRAMEIIKELEPDPRGIYTGAIGCIAPEGKSLFNVAIRTVMIEKESGRAEYGVGGGVVWDSLGRMEYSECIQKAKVLKSRHVEFRLLETMLWTHADGYAYLDEHLSRISGSAEYFDIPLELEDLMQKLISLSSGMSGAEKRIRLLVDRKGEIDFEVADINGSDNSAVRLGIAKMPVDCNNVFLYHKTTNRDFYEEARESCPECDDVVMWNEQGEVTETTIANIVIVKNGKKLTPPVECGLLGGTMRQALLESREIDEAKFTLDDVKQADEIFLINSVRGWQTAQLVLKD